MSPCRVAATRDALGREMLLCCGGSKHTPCTQVRDAGSCFRDRSLAGAGTEAPQPAALGHPIAFALL